MRATSIMVVDASMLAAIATCVRRCVGSMRSKTLRGCSGILPPPKINVSDSTILLTEKTSYEVLGIGDVSAVSKVCSLAVVVQYKRSNAHNYIGATEQKRTT